ncbi:MAG: TetR/AcrR family transcriptional regulator [Bacillota bacterium]|nr:TetR/AcrR family transcriptional regulator [Bacillota bacterium]
MPKSFSDDERAYIKRKLMEAAKGCIAQYGVRKTTVDELVKRANIPKGTFYLFYESKELLFFDVLCEFHDEMHKELLKEAAAIQDDITPQKLTDLLLGLYKMVGESFAACFLNDGEMELLLRKLPPEIAKEHVLKDNFDVENLFAVAPQLNGIDVKAMSAALRAVFLTMLYKKEIGEDVYDDALRILIYGIVLQMFEGDKA